MLNYVRVCSVSDIRKSKTSNRKQLSIHPLQRAFRVQWAKDKANEMKLERETTERAIELDESAGSYEPFDVVVQREGGGDAGFACS